MKTITSGEALKRLQENVSEMCDFLTRKMNIIKKDLEMLEIIKNHLYYDDKKLFIKMKPIRKSLFNYDYEDLRKWLENDK